MPTYKDQQRGTWYARFYYYDHEGNRHQKMKRGFALKREAEEFERNFLKRHNYNPDMLFREFVEIYFNDVRPQLREHSMQTKGYKFKNHLLPYFGDMPLSEITAQTVRAWHNTLIDRYRLSTINSLQFELSAVFNHAVRYYGMRLNPVRLAGKAKNPNELPNQMAFWTFDEYSAVISNIKDLKARSAVSLLYWSGMRKGELLALTWGDLDLDRKTVTISKSYQRLNGRPVITPTKTYESRTIILPDVCMQQLTEYHQACPETAPDAPVFIWEKRFIENGMRAGRTAAGVKHLHVHGLRHSHASYLIHRGVNIALVSKRLGHEKVSTTLDTYTHFFPSDEHSFINQINRELIAP